MNRTSLALIAFLGWGLFALSLFSPAPADQRDGGGSAVAGVPCPADIAPAGGDGSVGVPDLLMIINNWGACPTQCQSAGDCDDGNPCTTDICVAGDCQHEPIAGCCFADGDCDPVPNGTPVCINNQCQVLCDPGYTDCGGFCVDHSTDVQHCGACNTPCIASGPCMIAVCVDGQCAEIPLPAGTACPDGLCDGAGQCVECLSAGDCPPPPDPCLEYICIEGQCVLVPVANGTACPGGVCDNGVCVQF